MASYLLQTRLAPTLRSCDNWNLFDHTAPMIGPDKPLNSSSWTVRDVTPAPAADNGFATRWPRIPLDGNASRTMTRSGCRSESLADYAKLLEIAISLVKSGETERGFARQTTNIVLIFYRPRARARARV